MKVWAVIGAGPCGVATVGRLLTIYDNTNVSIIWIDPSFTAGRLHEKYRNVPGNTTKKDLVSALRLCPPFNFDYSQDIRKYIDHECQLIRELHDNQCPMLGTFADALLDATSVLRSNSRVHCISGWVEQIEKVVSGSHFWQIQIKLENVGEKKLVCCQNLVLSIGARPILPVLPVIRSYNVHDMEELVDRENIISLFDKAPYLRQAKWVVAGSSHSAMLILMNLIEEGATNVLNIYRSELKFYSVAENGTKIFPGSGLKGPVGAWVRAKLSVSPISRIRFQPNKSWDEQLNELEAEQVVFALGFRRVGAPTILIEEEEEEKKVEEDETSLEGVTGHAPRYKAQDWIEQQLDSYDKLTGEIFGPGSGFYGAGIAFPQDYVFCRDGDGGVDGGTMLMRDPWIGFKRSVEQTDLMAAISDDVLKETTIK